MRDCVGWNSAKQETCLGSKGICAWWSHRFRSVWDVSAAIVESTWWSELCTNRAASRYHFRLRFAPYLRLQVYQLPSAPESRSKELGNARGWAIRAAYRTVCTNWPVLPRVPGIVSETQLPVGGLQLVSSARPLVLRGDFERF